ncbi:hypothetical protein BC941DRAFT_516704 [Chlamydoabsidia padenii]|nr:hypothetical protein BC941DRAFT_516704 [Chlamydoabsidia padenii]
METNKWVPLLKLAHGIAIATFTATTTNIPATPISSSPLLRPTITSSVQLPISDASALPTKRLSTTSDYSTSSNSGDYTYMVPLEVGDELYIFEQQDGWYRGYVIGSLENNNIPSIGIFPKSHVHVIKYLDSTPCNNELIPMHQQNSNSITTSEVCDSDMLPMSPTQPFENRFYTGCDAVSSSSLPALTTRPQSGDQQYLMLAPTSNPSTKPIKRAKSTKGYRSCPTSGIDFDTNNLSSADAQLGSNSTTQRSLSLSPPPSTTISKRNDQEQQKQQNRPLPPPLPLARFEQSTVSGLNDPLVDEIAACIREWYYLLYTYLERKKYGQFNTIRDYINYLYQARRQLLDQVLSREETSRLRKEVIRRMVVLGITQQQDMIIRHPERGYILDIDNTSVSALYHMHWKYTISGLAPMTSRFTQTLLDATRFLSSNISNGTSYLKSSPTIISNQQEASAGYFSSLHNQQHRRRHQTDKRKPSYHYKGGEFHHLLLDLKTCMAHICQPGEWTELQFSLYSDSQGKFVTEQFVVHLNHNGVPKDVDRTDKLQTLFMDLSNQDLNDSLYLVCYIYRLGAMKSTTKEKEHLLSLGSHTSSIFNNLHHHQEGKGHSIFDNYQYNQHQGAKDSSISNGHQHNHHVQTARDDTKGYKDGYFDNVSHSHHHQHESALLPSLAHTNLFRRPFGCAVLNVGRLLQQVDQVDTATQSLKVTSGSWSAPIYSDVDQKKRQTSILLGGKKLPEVSTASSAPQDGTSTGVNSSYFLPEISTPISSVTQGRGNESSNNQTWHYHITPGEHNMRIYTPTSESNFSYLHQYIIRDNIKEFTQSPRADLLCVLLQMFYGRKNKVLKTNADLLNDTPLTARIGFPDVVFPDDERNELYITLNSGHFAHLGRTRNIQVIICVRDNYTGDVVEMAVAVGSGTPQTSTWESTVYYHEVKPVWNERVKVKIKDVNVWQHSHIFFVVKHRSRHGGGPSSMNDKDGGHHETPTTKAEAWKRLTAESNTSSSDKILAMGYIPLFIPPLSHDFVADGTHTLCLYKYDKHFLRPSSYFGIVPWCSQTTSPSNMQGQESMLTTILKAYRQRRMSTSNHTASHHTLMSIMGLQHSRHPSHISTSSQGTGASVTDNNYDAGKHHHFDNGGFGGDGNNGRPHAIRDSLVISTFLCSTRFTQNTALVQLINWRSIVEDSSGNLTTTQVTNGEGVTELLSMLDKFTFVGEQEVVKFLADIFDALLDILIFRVPDSLERQHALQDQVIVAIIWVLSIVEDRRFSNFRPVLHVYINQRFYCSEDENDNDNDGDEGDCTILNQTDEMINNMNLHGTPTIRTPSEYAQKIDDSVYRRDADGHGTYQLYTSYRYRQKHSKNLRRRVSLAETTYHLLLEGLIRLATNPSDITKAKTLRSSIKVWEYLFRFIEQSREMQRINEYHLYHEERERSYKQDLRQFFDLATQMMQPDQPSSMIGTQTLVLQYFCEAITVVKAIYSSKEIVDIISTMMDACSHFSGKLVGFKLSMILAFIRSPIFSDEACCCELGIKSVGWIRIWLNSYMEVAKEVIFSRTTLSNNNNNNNNNNQNGDDVQQQARLPRAQWIENLRLSLTIIHELLEKTRKVRGMYTSDISPAALVLASPSTTTSGTPISGKTTSRTRPVSLSTICDEYFETTDCDYDKSQHTRFTGAACLDEFTGALIQLVPQMLQTYKDLQRLTSQAIQASNAPTSSTSGHKINSNAFPKNSLLAKNDTYDSLASSNTMGGATLLVGSKTNSRQSLAALRDRANSTRLVFQSQEQTGINNTIDHLRVPAVSGSFPMVLRALETSPTIPFPSSYPFQVNTSNEIADLIGADLAALVTSGLMDLTVVILDLFHLTPDTQWLACFKDMARNKDSATLNNNGGTGPEEMGDFICTLCYVCSAMLFGDDIQKLAEIQGTIQGYNTFLDDLTSIRRKWPNDWLNLDVVAHKIILMDILAPITSLLASDMFIPKELQNQQQQTNGGFDNMPGNGIYAKGINDDIMVRLWRTVFMTVVRVLASPSLEVEDMLPQSQRAVWKLAGDIRGEGTRTLKQLWALTRPLKFSLGVNQNEQESKDLKMKPQLLDYFDQHRRSSIEIDITDSSPSLYIFGGDGHDDTLDMNCDKLPTEYITRIHLESMPVLLMSLCAASLTLNDRLRQTTVGMIADMLAIHIPRSNDAETGQNLMIGTIDKLVMTLGKGSDEIRVKWVAELQQALMERLSTELDREWGLGVVDSLANLMELLLQIRSLPVDNAEFMDERINATLKLLKFIQVFERQEIYIKYVHQLVDLHLHNDNFVEAALTLRFHANLLPWDPYTEVDAIPELGFGLESAFARKYKLYNTMITYLDKGTAWELCVDLCHEMGDQFATTLVNYEECGKILRQTASFMENIINKERYYSEYFRVGFYGRGFPASIRNQHFIYRGMSWEKMDCFVERMQNRHPNAQLIPGKIATSPLLSDDYIRELETDLDGQYLQITSVTPVLDTNANTILTNSLVPDKIKKYYQSNMVKQFTYSRLVNKEDEEGTGGSNTMDGNNTTVDDGPPTLSKQELDFLNLWTEKTTFTSDDTFPTITLRSKILAIELREISPIENAVDAMNNKTNELSSLDKTYSAYVSNPQVAYNLNPFSMALNGAVDAPVNGGVPLYKKAFMSDYYWHKNPDMHEWVDRLKVAIDEQVIVIDRCLDTHEKLVCPEMRPFHDNLVKLYKKNFAKDINQLTQQGTTFTSVSTTTTNITPKEKENINDKSSKKTNPYSTNRLSMNTSASHPNIPSVTQNNRGSGSFFRDICRPSITKSKTTSTNFQQQNRQSLSPSFGGTLTPANIGSCLSSMSATNSTTYLSPPNLFDDLQQQQPPARYSDDENYTNNNDDPGPSQRSRQNNGESFQPKDRPSSRIFDSLADGHNTTDWLAKNLRMSLRKATRRSTFSSDGTHQ